MPRQSATGRASARSAVRQVTSLKDWKDQMARIVQRGGTSRTVSHADDKGNKRRYKFIPRAYGAKARIEESS